MWKTFIKLTAVLHIMLTILNNISKVLKDMRFETFYLDGCALTERENSPINHQTTKMNRIRSNTRKY